MEYTLELDSSMSMPNLIEQRRKARIKEHFPVKVQGIDEEGQAFSLETRSEDISANGLFLLLKRRVEKGMKLLITVKLTIARSDDVVARQVAMHSIVVRAEPVADDLWGVGLTCTHHRFL